MAWDQTDIEMAKRDLDRKGAEIVSFTDEDVKRLKFLYCTGDPSEQDETICALLARLEAAERVIATEPNWIGPGRMAYQAWLKSAGREGR